jgi:ATP-dependent DNA ligase
MAPPSGEVATQFQSDSSPTDSPVRVRYAQPGSPSQTRTVGDARLHEIKHDGFRIIAWKNGNRVRSSADLATI